MGISPEVYQLFILFIEGKSDRNDSSLFDPSFAGSGEQLSHSASQRARYGGVSLGVGITYRCSIPLPVYPT